MLNQRLAVTRTITQQLAELEKQIDDAFVMHSQLQISLVEGRRTAHLPLDAGQAGLESMIAAGASLVAARKAVHAAHYDFREVRDQLRLPAFAYGDTGDTPTGFASTASTEPGPTLALVDAA